MTVSVLFYGFLCIFALTTLTGWNRSHDKKNCANQMFFRCFLMDQNVMVPFCFHGLGRSLHCVSQLTSFLHTDHYLNQKCHIWIHPFISPVTTNFQFSSYVTVIHGLFISFPGCLSFTGTMSWMDTLHIMLRRGKLTTANSFLKQTFGLERLKTQNNISTKVLESHDWE